MYSVMVVKMLDRMTCVLDHISTMDINDLTTKGISECNVQVNVHPCQIDAHSLKKVP